MKKINQEEYEVLKELDDKWEWIARDSNASLWVYKTKPRRCGGSIEWEDPVEGNYHHIDGDRFSFVRWEDEEPYSIAELIEEYENSAEHVSHVVNQLDEPELPVIPKFVAEWIEKYNEYGYDLYSALKKMENNARAWFKTYHWYRNNTLKFVNAYLTREYKLEKEPLYRARLKIITSEFNSYLRTQSSDSGERLKAFEIGSKYTHEDYRHLSEFTEDELRVIDIWGSVQWEIEEVEE